MEANVLEIVHIGVTIAIAVIGALVIQPIREIRNDLSDLIERIARLEGREQLRAERGWNGDDRRHGR